MIAALNRVWLMGNVGRYAPSLKYANNGTPCAAFKLCLTELSADGRPFTTLVDVEVWGKKAEATSTLEPGAMVTLEGRIARRKAKDGTSWEMCVSTFEVQSIAATLSAGAAEV